MANCKVTFSSISPVPTCTPTMEARRTCDSWKDQVNVTYDSGLLLGVKTGETHEWRKTLNTKKPLKSQHNRAKENNYYKTEKKLHRFLHRGKPRFCSQWQFFDRVWVHRFIPPTSSPPMLRPKGLISTHFADDFNIVWGGRGKVFSSCLRKYRDVKVRILDPQFLSPRGHHISTIAWVVGIMN